MHYQLILFFVAALYGEAALAGWADGPYIVWINYEKNEPEKTDKIAKDLFNERDSCIDYTRNPIFYMRKRPENITNENVYKAIVEKDSKAQDYLYNAIINYKDKSIWDPNNEILGLDGVIAYIPSPKPHLISFSFNKHTKKYKIKEQKIARQYDKNSIRNALCKVMPEITRD